jgi:hypothetical protein
VHTYHEGGLFCVWAGAHRCPWTHPGTELHWGCVTRHDPTGQDGTTRDTTRHGNTRLDETGERSSDSSPFCFMGRARSDAFRLYIANPPLWGPARGRFRPRPLQMPPWRGHSSIKDALEASERLFAWKKLLRSWQSKADAQAEAELWSLGVLSKKEIETDDDLIKIVEMLESIFFLIQGEKLKP